MLEKLFGGAAAERVLLYLDNYEEGYAKGIATTFEIPLNAVQKQLMKFESAGILVSQMKGRTRLFLWNPRYPFQRELRSLLSKALEFLPESEVKRYYRQRTRPRLTGKPL
jgi:hypothetical protein